MSAPLSPIQAAFESAKREFQASLRDDGLYDKILQTTSIEQVYDATDELQKE